MPQALAWEPGDGRRIAEALPALQLDFRFSDAEFIVTSLAAPPWQDSRHGQLAADLMGATNSDVNAPILFRHSLREQNRIFAG